jgi:hypothetical protein
MLHVTVVGYMTIQYALTRSEIATGFFRSLRTSPRFLFTICFYAICCSGLFLAASGSFSRPLEAHDALKAAYFAIAFFSFMPAYLFLRAKTSRRTLTISPDGISTEIGKIKAQRPWSYIKTVAETDGHVLIASATGNAFFIPNRAFSNFDQKREFVAKAKAWKSAMASGR